MRLTTKGRFAVTAMIDIALHNQAGPVSLAAVSERQRMSLSYLEQLFGKLRRSGLVESIRGPGGGYRLARKAGEISVADIIIAVDESASVQLSEGDGPATRTDVEGDSSLSLTRSTEELWASLNQRMLEFLGTINLQKLAEDQIAKGVQVSKKAAPAKNAVKAAPARQPVLPRAPASVFALGNTWSKS